jgi:hypothetical protein
MKVITVVLKSGLEIIGRFPGEDEAPQMSIDNEGQICVVQMQCDDPTPTVPDPQPEPMMIPFIILAHPLRQLSVQGAKGMVNALVPISSFSPNQEMLPIQCSDILLVAEANEAIADHYIKITSSIDLPAPAASRIITG